MPSASASIEPIARRALGAADRVERPERVQPAGLGFAAPSAARPGAGHRAAALRSRIRCDSSRTDSAGWSSAASRVDVSRRSARGGARRGSSRCSAGDTAARCAVPSQPAVIAPVDQPEARAVGRDGQREWAEVGRRSPLVHERSAPGEREGPARSS